MNGQKDNVFGRRRSDVRLSFHVRLTKHDYNVVFAVDGVSGINEARMQKPDLIILDL